MLEGKLQFVTELSSSQFKEGNTVINWQPTSVNWKETRVSQEMHSYSFSWDKEVPIEVVG